MQSHQVFFGFFFIMLFLSCFHEQEKNPEIRTGLAIENPGTDTITQKYFIG